MMDRIDISPLVNAVERLREGLDRHRREPADEQLRDGLIQRFEFDLALEWDRPLGLALLGRIAEALSESDLPYKVDIVDLLTTDPAFRARIAEESIPFEPME